MKKIDELIKIMEEKRKTLQLGGGEEAIKKQHKLGKLTARERLDLLLDKDSFIENDLWLKNRCQDFDFQNQEFPGEGAAIGYGKVNGKKIFTFSQDFTLMGGSLGEAQGTKLWRIWEQAMRVGVPIVGINDSGGARVQEGMGALNGYCALFFQNSVASGWIPQISVVLGPCAGGAVYSPAITDFIVVVEGVSKMFITGPAVIEAVTGEKITVDKLGGVAVHTQKTGVAHFAAQNEEHAFGLVRDLLSYLPQNSKEKPPVYANTDPVDRETPILKDLIPVDSGLSYDVREIIEEVVDDRRFLEVHKDFATNIVVGFARMDGHSVGIVANQTKFLAGCLDVNASWKAARFVRFCDAFNIPLVTFVDCPGYLPGVNQEHQGIIRNGAKLLYSFSEATVPKITVVLRKSYGGAYSAMCGKGLGADIVLTVPTAEIAVVGPEAAANLVFKKEIDAAKDPAAKRAELVEDYRTTFATPYKAAEWGLVDEIIDPTYLRQYLVKYLDVFREKTEWRPYKKHSNLPL